MTISPIAPLLAMRFPNPLAFLPRFGKRQAPVQPAMILHWHGGRAALDSRGSPGGPPCGLADLRRAGVTHVGCPQHWETGLVNERLAGFQIIRTIEQAYNAGLPAAYADGRVNLGKVILDFQSPAKPGELLGRFMEMLYQPCNGLGWNLEHDILNRNKYPLTDEDCAFQRQLPEELRNKDPENPTFYPTFRCFQFAILARLYYFLAFMKFASYQQMVCYSGYEGLRYRGLHLPFAYGVSWKLLATGHLWKSLSPITHAMCAWWEKKLPKEALKPTHSLPILHTIAIPPAVPVAEEEDYWRAVACNRLACLRPGDGLGLVHGRPGPEGAAWGPVDQLVCRVVGEELERSR